MSSLLWIGERLLFVIPLAAVTSLQLVGFNPISSWILLPIAFLTLHELVSIFFWKNIETLKSESFTPQSVSEESFHFTPWDIMLSVCILGALQLYGFPHTIILIGGFVMSRRQSVRHSLAIYRLGYRLYKVSTESGKEVYVFSKKYIRTQQPLSQIRPLDNFTYIIL